MFTSIFFVYHNKYSILRMKYCEQGTARTKKRMYGLITKHSEHWCRCSQCKRASSNGTTESSRKRRVTRSDLCVRFRSIKIIGRDPQLRLLTQHVFHSEEAAASAHLTPASLHGRLTRLRQARRTICPTMALACALYTSSQRLATAVSRPLSLGKLSSGHLLQYGDGNVIKVVVVQRDVGARHDVRL